MVSGSPKVWPGLLWSLGCNAITVGQGHGTDHQQLGLWLGWGGGAQGLENNKEGGSKRPLPLPHPAPPETGVEQPLLPATLVFIVTSPACRFELSWRSVQSV